MHGHQWPVDKASGWKVLLSLRQQGGLCSIRRRDVDVQVTALRVVERQIELNVLQIVDLIPIVKAAIWLDVYLNRIIRIEFTIYSTFKLLS